MKYYKVTIQINEQKITVYEQAKDEMHAVNNAIRQSMEYYHDQIAVIKVLECYKPGEYDDTY